MLKKKPTRSSYRVVSPAPLAPSPYGAGLPDTPPTIKPSTTTHDEFKLFLRRIGELQQSACEESNGTGSPKQNARQNLSPTDKSCGTSDSQSSRSFEASSSRKRKFIGNDDERSDYKKQFNPNSFLKGYEEKSEEKSRYFITMPAASHI